MENNEFLIVGIGASAGGMDPIFELFSQMPPKINAAFVVIRHLLREHKSVFAGILQRNTRLKVVEITGGEIVSPGIIYVLPEGKKVRLENNKLVLEERSAVDKINNCINDFLISLGSIREKAVAIILSGYMWDGIEGIKVIGANGGTVFVQDPQTAEVPVLPNNAIKLDSPDYVLPVHEIRDCIIQMADKISIPVKKFEKN